MLVEIKKCEFFIRKTDFIRFIIKLSKISIDRRKVKAIVSWQELQNVIQLRSVLGIFNYYRSFIAQQLNVRVYILGPAALATSSQALSVFLAVWRRGGGPRYIKAKVIKPINTLFIHQTLIKRRQVRLPYLYNYLLYRILQLL